MTIRFILAPGRVVSRRDGLTHFVGARDLAYLYGVPLSRCLLMPSGFSAHDVLVRREMRRRAVRQKLIVLEPRSDGDYRLPLPLTEESAP